MFGWDFKVAILTLAIEIKARGEKPNKSGSLESPILRVSELTLFFCRPGKLN